MTQRAVLSASECPGAPLAMVGAKAATLARLAGEHIPVPDFFVVSSAAFAAHLEHSGIQWPQEWDGDRAAALRAAILASPVPDALRRSVLAAYEALCRASGHGHVAVRSSGSEEDSASASFAGQFGTLVNVHGSRQVLDSVKECWASSLSARSLAYRASRGLAPGPRPTFGVIVQVQVFAARAGVLFTRHPLDPSSDVAYLEANFGTGEAVVGGLVTPDAVSISRLTGQVVDVVTATKRRMTVVSADTQGSALVEVDEPRRCARVVDDDEAQAIARMGLRIEGLLGGPQDVEWACGPRQLWILQSRPITSRTVDGR